MKTKTATLFTLGFVLAAAAMAQVVRNEMVATLTGSGLAAGKAKYKAVTKPRQVEAQVEVEAEDLVPGATYSIRIEGLKQVTTTADSFGSIVGTWRFRNEALPSLTPGGTLYVNDASGNTVLAGVWRAK